MPPKGIALLLDVLLTRRKLMKHETSSKLKALLSAVTKIPCHKSTFLLANIPVTLKVCLCLFHRQGKYVL